jgi:hypothetical protein
MVLFVVGWHNQGAGSTTTAVGACVGWTKRLRLLMRLMLPLLLLLLLLEHSAVPAEGSAACLPCQVEKAWWKEDGDGETKRLLVFGTSHTRYNCKAFDNTEMSEGGSLVG